jgi:hypothetical protein
MRTIIVVFIACFLTCSVASIAPIFALQTFNQRVPAANHEKYKSVRGAKDWANPYLVVLRDGIEVVSSALPSGRKVVAASALRETLTGLPTTAWPYGRVVAVQENGVRSREVTTN